MTIKKDHYKMSLVLGEDDNISLHIQLRSPYMGHVIMTFSFMNPKNSMYVFKQFLHELAETSALTEVLESIGSLLEFKANIERMCAEYRELTR